MGLEKEKPFLLVGSSNSGMLLRIDWNATL